MLAHGERLSDCCPAKTGLRRTGRIYLNKHASGAFSLVRDHVQELRPSGIVNALGEHSACQTLDVQIFDRDQSVVVNDLSRLFVMEISALIADVVVPPLEQKHGLAPPVRTFLPSRYAPLQAAEFGLSIAEPARVLNHDAVAQCGKGGKADVDTGHVRAEGQRFRFALNREDSKPPTRFTLNQESLNYSIKRAVQLYFDGPDFREPEFVATKSIANLPECQTVVTACGSETRIASLLTTLDAAKKPGKSKMDTLKDIFKYLGVNCRNVVSILFNLWQLQYLIEERNRFSFKVPSVTSLLQGAIVKLCAYCKSVFESRSLTFGGINPVFECAVQG